MSFEGGPTNPQPATKASGENLTPGLKVTPPTAGHVEVAGEEVNSPACQVEERHLPPSSSTPADPAMMAVPSMALVTSATVPPPPLAPATAPEVVQVQENYTEMSVMPSEAASTLRH